jgi:hypothetical protein
MTQAALYRHYDADGALHFHAGRYGEAAELVIRHHYSRRVPSNVQCVGTLHESGGLFDDYGDAVAACFFSLPPTRWSEEVWELSRLVRDHERRPLVSLIAKTCKVAKAKGAHLLVSFADRTHGHHGGVYQAASWAYGGARERRMDGVVVDGRFVPGRSANNQWGTQSPAKLASILRKPVAPHFDEGKHIYWRALTKEGRRRAKRLGLEAMPYPKPAFAEAAE